MKKEETLNTPAAIKLPEQVAKKYQITGENPSRISAWRRYGMIDLNSISLDKAEMLVKEGFPYLKAKKAQKKD